MERHRSCMLPSNAPALPEHNLPIPNRGMQERSVNRRHDYTSEASASWKRSSSPVENVYLGQLGSCFPSGIGAQLNSEKSEAQVEQETKRLLMLLERCEKYTEYRSRQPQTAKDREQRWPDHLEEAFFRGLVRWPPMGRRKHMLDGQLRGRNELVADSIQRDTGEPRSRKQVSSHIQVLKNKLAGQPQILVYMSTEDMGGRRNRHNSSHFSHLRSRHQSHSKHDYPQGGSNAYQRFGQLPSSAALAKIQSGQDNTPYTVSNFDMFVEVAKKRFHNFTQLNGNSRLSDLNVMDTTSWHKQYPEFNFHRTDEFKYRHVLVCDASIKVMTLERPPNCELNITFDLHSQVDLSIYDSLECRTRFFENGKPADQLDDRQRKVKQTRTNAGYYPEHGGLLRVKFGANFWAHQMQRLGHILRKAGEEEQSARARYETLVRRELQYMTAAQSLYSVKNGEYKCLLTILWRFNQTKNSHEPGRVTWRAVNFGRRNEKDWTKEEQLEKIRNAEGLISMVSSSTAASMPTSASSIYPPLPPEFHQPFGQHPPPLDLETLALEPMASDFSNPNSATAPSLVTDYSQTQSLPSISHSQDIALNQNQDLHNANDFDFNGGHITISGCLEPSINLGIYEPYNPLSNIQTLTSLHTIAGLDANDAHHNDSFGDLTLGVSMANCYASKPSWHHPSLISNLESAAEQYGGLIVQSDTEHVDSMDAVVDVNVAEHSVWQGGHVDDGLWKLQSAFGEDTGVGAVYDHRKDSLAEHGLSGQGILELMDMGRRKERLGDW